MLWAKGAGLRKLTRPKGGRTWLAGANTCKKKKKKKLQNRGAARPLHPPLLLQQRIVWEMGVPLNPLPKQWR